METLVYHDSLCKINPLSIAYALRAGYLLSDKVTAAGTIHYGLLYLRYMQEQSLDAKINFIENHPPTDLDIEGLKDLKELAQHSRATLKVLRGIKHPTPDQIIYRKKVERS